MDGGSRWGRSETTTARAVTPLVGILTVVGLTVALSAAAGVVVVGVSDTIAEAEATTGSIVGGTGGMDLSVEGQTVTLTPTHGDPIDMETLRLVVEVDGDPLISQPPVPFFSAAGFQPGPSGAFNSAASGPWEIGQSSSFSLAGTNAPTIEPGATVSVRLYDENTLLLTVETTAK